MASAGLLEQAKQEAWDDEQVVNRVLAGETALYELLMRRYNQRLYRVARAILRDDSEAEDVMQDAFVRAYQHLSDFEGRAKFSTWLTRIAVHEALARARRHLRFQSLDHSEDSRGGVMKVLASAGRNPEEAAVARANLDAAYRDRFAEWLENRVSIGPVAPQDFKVIGLVSSAHFMSHFFQIVLPPIFPLLKDAFGMSYAELGSS